jgi:hypothetical protein
MNLAILIACSAVALFAQMLPGQEESEARFGTTVVISAGLQGQIYHINKFSKQLPDFDKKKPVGTIYTTSLNIPRQDFRAGFPGVSKRTEGFAIDYTGKFWIEKPGKYKFVLTSDDGSRLYIDDRIAVDNDGVHPVATKEGTVELSGGVHRIRVSYFQGPGYELALVLRVQAPGAGLRVFSTDDYKQPSTLETLPSQIPR